MKKNYLLSIHYQLSCDSW